MSYRDDWLKRVAVRALWPISFAAGALLVVTSLIGAQAQGFNVTTHHYNNQRTGWNSQETVLTPQNVGSPQFRLQLSVPLDAQVDAQPLVVAGQGGHDRVYVVTENNSIYEFDAQTGAALATQNLGTPVPLSQIPGQCNNNSNIVGINSTPVIDPASGTMYVIAWTMDAAGPTYRIHALDINTLADKVAPVVVDGANTLVGGSSISFNPTAVRSRAALLLSNGSVYAAFATFCDFSPNLSRGWVFGWNAATLAPMQSTILINHLTSTPNNWLISNIWMSGGGLATDGAGNLFFTTANADPSGTTYDPQLNLAESVLKVAPDLSSVLDYFTPANESDLDIEDLDLGSGGVTILAGLNPASGPPFAPALLAGGKDGNLYMLNLGGLGGFNPGSAAGPIGVFPIGPCWCQPSAYLNAAGQWHVVTSGGSTVMVWGTVPNTSGTAAWTLQQFPSLTQNIPPSGQDPGFFTTVSSNAFASPIIWAVGRPVDASGTVTLYAFNANDDGTARPPLQSVAAGTWPNLNANANIVPVVANGRVYVASYQQLAIFGVSSGAPVAPALVAQVAPQPPTPPAAVPQTSAKVTSLTDALPPAEHEITGVAEDIDGAHFSLKTRSGKLVQVDGTAATKAHLRAVLITGEALLVRGSYNGAGTLVARSVMRAKNSSAFWRPDS